MKRWHSFFEVLQQPLKMLFLATILLGIGNLLINPVFNPYWVNTNQYVILFAEAIIKIGTFLVINFPFFFFLRLVSRKSNGIVTILIGLFGYFTFVIFTIFFAEAGLPQTAFSSIFGISMTSSQLAAFSGKVHYPLQTGIIGVIVITFTTRLAFQQSRAKSSYGIFGFVDRDTWGMLLNFIYAILAAFIISISWSYLFQGIDKIATFISSDLSNPINIFVYGVTDRILSIFGLGSFIRQPFWFGNLGGTWINMVGESIAGDVAIWTTMVSQNLVPTTAGRFITPYYIINIFAIPGMIWAFFATYTDKMERRRIRLFFILATLVSMFAGTLLPLEIMLILVCPLLFVFHILYTGILFGVFQALKVAMGFSYSGNVTVALPGNLLEFFNFVRNANYNHTVYTMLAVGVITFIIYYFVTRGYYKYLALDLFNSGVMRKYTDTTIEAMGGTANIKMLHASINRLTIQVFDTSDLKLSMLSDLGATRIVETRAGYSIDFGSGSTMIKQGIEKQLRNIQRSA